MTEESPNKERSRPVLIELSEEDTGPSPAEAEAVADFDGPPPRGQAMVSLANFAARKPSALTRWFFRFLAGILVFVLSVSAWNFVTTLITQNPVLGYVAAGLVVGFVLICLAIVIREVAALSRLSRIDHLQSEAESVLADADPNAANHLRDRLIALYSGRTEMRWALDRIEAQKDQILDGDGTMALCERELMAPLDALALKEIEAASRQVAMITAMVPLALADVVTALTANLRMIRRLAEIYGGRAGFFGGWRLTRSVLTHLVATGAVAVGDDLLGSLAGGGVLSKLSRRFGEGVINGALTARVGVAAMEVCRPLPFHALDRPSVTGLVRRALTGLFGQGTSPKEE